MKDSSTKLWVYKNLKSILGNTKSHILRTAPTNPSIITLSIQCCSVFHAAHKLKKQSFHPIITCTSKDSQISFSSLIDGDFSNSELRFLLQTSLTYPLCSSRYRKYTQNFRSSNLSFPCYTMSAFIPCVVVINNDEGEQLKSPYTVDVAILSSMADIKYSSKIKIITSKICSVFDIALHRRSLYSKEHKIPYNKCCYFIDSIIFGDLNCRTTEEKKMYVEAVFKILPTYSHQFRQVFFAIEDPELYSMMYKYVYPR